MKKDILFVLFIIPAIFVFIIVGGAILFVVSALVWGYPLMLLWNVIMPQFFKLPTVTYWTAVGIFLLASLILKGQADNGMGTLVKQYLENKKRKEQEERERREKEERRRRRQAQGFREEGDFEF